MPPNRSLNADATGGHSARRLAGSLGIGHDARHSDFLEDITGIELSEPLAFNADFSEHDSTKLLEGLVPEQMEDKWFIYHADGWLRFHRSWTGTLIYWLRLDRSPTGLRVTKSWVNRDPDQYQETDTSYDRKLVRFLVDALLLKQKAVFQSLRARQVMWPMPCSTPT
jgi:hypothetical protein